MKKLFQLVAVVGLGVIFNVINANGQAPVKVSADIPFEFSVCGRSYRAGTYEIEVSKNNSGGATVTVIDKQGGRVNSFLGKANGNSTRGKSQLVFERAGDQRFLSEIVSSNSGISLPVSRRQKRAAGTLGVALPKSSPIALTN